MLQPAHGVGEPVVVGEDDDLSVDGDVGQHPGQAVDLGRVHGLDRVVDEHEPERALLHGGPGQEQRQAQRVQLALAHDAERRPTLGAVDADGQCDVPKSALPVELDRIEVDVALLAQGLPDALGRVGEGGEAFVAQ